MRAWNSQPPARRPSPSVARLDRRLGLPELRNLNRLHTECRKHLKGKGEGEPAPVDAVDERLGLHLHALGHEVLRKLLVGDVLLLAEFFDERLGARLVQSSWAHGGRQIENELPAS